MLGEIICLQTLMSTVDMVKNFSRGMVACSFIAAYCSKKEIARLTPRQF